MENYNNYLSKYNPLVSTIPTNSINFDIDIPLYTPIDNTISTYNIEKVEPKEIPKLTSTIPQPINKVESIN